MRNSTSSAIGAPTFPWRGRVLRRLLLSLCVLSAFGPLNMAFAQSADPSQGTTPGTGVIAGRVLDAASGEVLGKAEVRLSGGPAGGSQPGSPAARAVVARTGADGAFLLQGIQAGDYVLSVSRRAYAACGSDVDGLPGRQQGCSTRFTLHAGQKLGNVQIRLLRAAVVTGEVRDEDGEPMAGVVVEAEQYRYLRGAKVLTATSRATSDDRGQYRLYNLSPGRYFVKAQGRGLMARLAGAMMAGGGPGRMGGAGGPGAAGGIGRGSMMAGLDDAITYPPTYYPKAEFPEEAIPLQLAPGAEMGGIDFRLTPTATYSLSGVVAGVTGEPMTGITVTARRAGSTVSLGGPTAFASADARTGAFTLRGLAPGRYELVARSMGMRRGAAQAAGASGILIADLGNAHLEGLTIPLRPDVQIQGSVLLPQNNQEAQIERMRVVMEGALPGPQRMARVDAEGRFQLALAAADRPSFSLEGLPEGFYVKAMKLGGVDVMAQGAEAPSEVLGEFQIQLAADGGKVSGLTRDGTGKAIASARVVLMPERTGQARQLWRKTAISGEDGTFQFDAVAPGRYRVYLFEELDSGPALDPDFLTNFGQRWRALEVKPGASATAESLLIPVSDTAMHLGEMAP
ncbi:MAG: carboxypeptidase regulatory-like domain-containing protein [Bryobacterales bacterium]|nr:carboxypeptidase regulatory-like domain-containing protein [Bryobacterales bacterium]